MNTTRATFEDVVDKHKAGDLAAAIAGYRAILAKEPDNKDARNNLGVALRADGQVKEAEQVFRDLVKHFPRLVKSRINMANLLVATGRSREAMGMLNQAAILAGREKRYDDAQKLFRRALAVDPSEPVLYNNMGNMALDRGDPDKAMAHFNKALSLKPHYTRARLNLGRALVAAGRPDEAREVYEAAVEMAGGDHTALHDLGLYHKQQGRLETARPMFHEVLNAEPDYLPSLIELNRIEKFDPKGTLFKSLEKHVKNLESVPKDMRENVVYAYAKSLNDLKRFDEAFQEVMRGAKMHRDQITYSEAGVDKFFGIIKSAFTPEVFEKFEGKGSNNETPVFILGMPRSGTTLTDQIIVSHADGGSLGETDQLRQVWNNFLAVRARPLTFETLTRISPAELAEVGDQYAAEMREKAPGALRIVEKEPSNFMRIGLISLILPKARILHCVRNPVDTCISCLFQKFHDDAQGWSYTLEELGRYYRRYLAMVDHWRYVLPGRFMDVVYEETIADQETQTRRILNHIGLPWDDKCLEFHKTDRPVLTSSIAQVRRPIYTDSMERWRRYERHLGPLFDALGADVLDRFGITPKEGA